LTRRQVSDREWVLWFQTSAEAARYVIPKGSVAVNGVSLTVASVSPPGFSVALIPTTLSRTTLVDLTEGDEVNLETDILARTVVHALEGLERAGGLTEAKLREHGFL
jgi:riboflavin synthase